MTTALIDAEAACHACSYACDGAGQGADEAASSAVGKVFKWIEAAGADRAVLAFSCPRELCFRRTDLAASYKAKRSPAHPFVARGDRVESMSGRSPSRAATGRRWVQRDRIEADDVIGMLATWPDRRGDVVIVARDEDMLQVPGRHYRPAAHGKPDEWVDVTPEQGEHAHMLATLTGCPGDNVPGCPGQGEMTAAKLFAGVGPAGRWDAILRAFKKKGLGEGDALTQARLVRVLRWGDYDPATSAVSLWSPGGAADVAGGGRAAGVGGLNGIFRPSPNASGLPMALARL